MNKLTEIDIPQIVHMHRDGMSQTEIAKLYGVGCSCISKAIQRHYGIGGDSFIPDAPKEPFVRHKGDYSNLQPFEYRLPVREKRI